MLNYSKKMLSVFSCLGIAISVALVPVHAKNDVNIENTENQDGIQTNDKGYVVIDGNVVYYDNTVIDGGISFEKPIEDTRQVRKTKVRKAATSAPANKTIRIPFEAQKNNYYCGPAAAKMVLGGIGISVTQDYMAQLLHTTSSSGTNAGDNVSNALNQVCKGSGFKFTWAWHTSRHESIIKSHIVEAISYGNPIMVNTYEGPGDSYLIGHDKIGKYFGHYGVVADYFNYGNEVTYTDPGYSVFSGFVMDQRATITAIDKACGQRGYAW